jgi:plasmid stabilization system protein ParE
MPSSRSISLTTEAELDFADIGQYTLSQWGEDQLDLYTDALAKSINRLASFPELGRQHSDLAVGIRSLASREHLIFYSFDASQIRVLRILHKRHLAVPGDFE